MFIYQFASTSLHVPVTSSVHKGTPYAGADQSGVQKLTAQLQAARDVLPALAVMLWLLPGMQHKVAAAWLDSVHAIMHVHVRRAPTAASSMLALVASHSVVQEVLSHCEESPALFGLADLLSMLAKQTETSHGTMPANTTALLHMYVVWQGDTCMRV